MSGAEGLLLGPVIDIVVESVEGAGRGAVTFAKKLLNAPEGFNVLIDELEQLDLTLESVERTVDAITQPPSELSELIKKYKSKRLQIKELVAYKLTKPDDGTKVDRLSWTKRSEEASRTVADLREILSKINIVIGATHLLLSSAHGSQSPSNENARRTSVGSLTAPSILGYSPCISSGLEQLSLASTTLRQEHQLTIESLTQHREMMSSLCSRLEECNETQTRLGELLGSQYRFVAPIALNNVLTHGVIHDPLIPKAYGQPRSSPTGGAYQSRHSNLNIRSLQQEGPECSKGCRCICHKGRSIGVPASTRRVFGALTIYFSNVSWLSPTCDIQSCTRMSRTTVAVQYNMPLWLANRLISAWYSGTAVSGHALLLKIAKVKVPRSEGEELSRSSELQELHQRLLTGKTSSQELVEVGGSRMLHHALCTDAFEVAEFLVLSGVDPSEADYCGRSPNDAALEQSFAVQTTPTELEILRRVFDLEAILYEQNFSAVHQAVVSRSAHDLRKELVKRQDLVHATDSHGRTPLHWAVLCDDPHAVEVLLEYSADVSAVSTGGNTVFHMCTPGIVEIAQILLPKAHNLSEEAREERRLIMNKCNDRGIAPFLVAIYNNNFEVLPHFLQVGCDFTLCDDKGATALHLASIWAGPDTAKVLMVPDMAVVDPDKKDKYGVTASQYLDWRFSRAAATSTKNEVALRRLIQYVRSLRHDVFSSEPTTNDRATMTVESDFDEDTDRSHDDDDNDTPDEDDSFDTSEEEEETSSDGEHTEEDQLFEDAVEQLVL